MKTIIGHPYILWMLGKVAIQITGKKHIYSSGLAAGEQHWRNFTWWGLEVHWLCQTFCRTAPKDKKHLKNNIYQNIMRTRPRTWTVEISLCSHFSNDFWSKLQFLQAMAAMGVVPHFFPFDPPEGRSNSVFRGPRIWAFAPTSVDDCMLPLARQTGPMASLKLSAEIFLKKCCVFCGLKTRHFFDIGCAGSTRDVLTLAFQKLVSGSRIWCRNITSLRCRFTVGLDLTVMFIGPLRVPTFQVQRQQGRDAKSVRDRKLRNQLRNQLPTMMQ